MSALGVTDGYHTDVIRKRKSSEGPLVLGVYPLSFIREAAEKFGAEFYDCYSPAAREIPGKWAPEPLSGARLMLSFMTSRNKIYSGIVGVPRIFQTNLHRSSKCQELGDKPRRECTVEEC